MAEPMKPKRGWICEEDIRDFEEYTYATIHCDPDGPSHAAIPALLVPDPDRDPTPEEIEALARRLHESEAWGGTFDADRTSCLIAARAAWRLGARVPS